jgi:hypothetical protein
MRKDAGDVGGDEFQKFISSYTDTVDGRTFLTVYNWEQVEEAWNNRFSPEEKKMREHPIQFEYCECGCHCHAAYSKGIGYTIYNSLQGNTPLSLRRGHGILGTQIGPLRDSFEACVKAAQDDFDKIP